MLIMLTSRGDQQSSQEKFLARVARDNRNMIITQLAQENRYNKIETQWSTHNSPVPNN